MKNTLAILSALALLGAASATTAQEFSITFGTQDHRYEQNYNRRIEREHRRFYAHQPSAWRNQCPRYEVLVRDPYTGRRVCIDRWEYRDHVREYHY